MTPARHRAHPDCWCKPTEVKPGVWVHGNPTLGKMTRTIGYHHPAGSPDIHLHVEAYLADEGDNK